MRLILLCAALVACKKPMPVEPAADDPMAEPLPVDVSIRTGKLDNGLTYFIEKNAKPENKAVLRLAVDAGSLLEDDDQLGVAHFLEHMAFNGTDSFPANALIEYLESVGTQFGPHLNAHTSFDETVYKLTVPTDDAEVFDKGLTVLEEWACCLTLDPEEIEKERGVVLEEWRLRQGIRERIADVRMPMTYAGARHVDRLPIGTEESLKTFDPAVVGRFYEDWYRPELMAVIVAGDVDVDAVEATLRERFADLTGPDEPRERVRFDVPAQEGPLYSVFADAELTASFLWVQSKYDSREPRTWGEWLEREHGLLATMVLNERLSDAAREPESPFLRAGGGASLLTPIEGLDSLSVSAKEGRELDAYEAVLIELKRFKTHGVTEPELERAKAARIEGMDKYEREAEDTDSRVHADEIVRHFLENEAMPGTRVEAELTRKATRETSLEDANRWAAEFFDDDRVTMLFMPEKDGLAVPTTDDLKAVEARVAEAEVEPVVAETTLQALVEPPAGGEIAERDDQYAESVGFEGFVLSNGIRVYAKRTDHKAGEILFQMFRVGGVEAVDDSEFVTSWASSRIRTESGLGEHDRSALLRYLKGKTVSVSAGLSSFETRLGGMASTRDLGVVLEAMYLYHTDPAFTEAGMTLALGNWRERLVNRRNDPDTQFSDAWRALFWPEDPRRQPLEPADLDGVELERAAQIWDDAMGTPSEWTAVFIGDLPEDFEVQIQTWLGAIPEGEPGLEEVDRGYRREPGVHREVLSVGSAERARYRTELWTEIEPDLWTREWRVHLSSFADVLGVLLRERMREDLGGVYGVRVSTGSWDFPYHGARLRVEFQCDPERLDELEAAMTEVLEGVVENGVEAKYIEAERAKNREWHEDSLQTNSRWFSAVMASLKNEEDPAEMLDFPEHNESFTGEVVKEMAKLLLTSEDRGTVVLLPKSEDAAPE